MVRARAVPVPGALETVAWLRSRGIRVGSCTGYNAPIIAAVQEEAAKHGLVVDAVEW